MKVTTPHQLKQAYRLESLSPFGIIIKTRHQSALEAICPQLLERLCRSEKLVILRGFLPLDSQSWVSFSRSVQGFDLLEWETGPVMEVLPRPNTTNYIFSREAVPFHWDGAFVKTPHYLLFQCCEAPSFSQGGQTLFTHSELMWQNADKKSRALWQQCRLTYETKKLAHYGGKVTHPLVQNHPLTGSAILRFAEPVHTSLNPVVVSAQTPAGYSEESLIAELSARCYSKEFCYEHQWETGDYLMADNFSLLHGRTAFLEGSERHLRRIQLISKDQDNVAS